MRYLSTGIKTRHTKQILLVIIVITLGAVLSVFAGYRQMAQQVKPLTAALHDGASLSLCSVRQTASRDGQTEWCMDAASVTYTEARRQAIFQSPSVTFFTDDDEVKMTAAQGVVQSDSNDMTADGKVVIQNRLYKLKTDKLNYTHKDRIFHTETPVEMSGKQLNIKADSASLNMEKNIVEFKGNVRGVLVESIRL